MLIRDSAPRGGIHVDGGMQGIETLLPEITAMVQLKEVSVHNFYLTLFKTLLVPYVCVSVKIGAR